MTSMFRLILSDFEYAGLQSASGTIAPVFLYGFAITISFIMLNMFIAIITEAFKDVSMVLSDFDPSTDSSDMTWVQIVLGETAQGLVDSYNDKRVLQYIKDKEEEEEKRLKEEASARKKKRGEGRRRKEAERGDDGFI